MLKNEALITPADNWGIERGDDSFDVQVSEVEELHDDHGVDKPFRAHFHNGLIAYFQSEDAACLFQRQWRALIGLDSFTGDPVVNTRIPASPESPPN